MRRSISPDSRAELKETNFNLGASPIRLAAVIDKFSPLTLSYNLKSSELALADIQASLQEERRSDVLRNLSSDGQVTTSQRPNDRGGQDCFQ